MCGITGLWAPDLTTETVHKRVTDSIDLIKHRGPDGDGVWVDTKANLALGHQRLSIIDVSEHAAQPFIHDSTRYALVFNGEIYNYQELKEQFIPSESLHGTYGDTAVLLELLVQKGEEALALLDGMFAFAFFDKQTQELLLARDRFGEKPLYWTLHENSFAFSSELTALKPLLARQRYSININALSMYHMLGSIPAPMSIYDDVLSLEPGCFLKYTANSSPKISKYWSIEYCFNSTINNINIDEAREQTQQLLKRAICSRMVSDVPVGVFLSGGIDSNAILSTLVAENQPPHCALCVDFPEKQFSEFSTAQASAKELGVPLERYTLDRSSFEKGLPLFFEKMDQPSVDGFNTFFLSMAAKQQGVKVWLSGVGGDELFGGYPSFKRVLWLQSVIALLQQVIPKDLALFLSGRKTTLRLSRILNSLVKGSPSLRAYQSNRLSLPPSRLNDVLITPTAHKENLTLLDSNYPKAPPFFDKFQSTSLYESAIYMRSQLLRDIDNFSMTHSIEVRSPFLCHKLFSSVMSLHYKYKQDGRRLKPLLQDSIPGGLPQAISTTQKKGFTFPVEKWLKKGVESNYRQVVLDKSNGRFWKLAELERVWNSYEKGSIHWSVLWPYYSYAMWLNKHQC